MAAGGTCGAAQCWAEKPKSFKYKNMAVAGGGTLKVTLSEGLTPAKAKVQLNAKGAFLDPPGLPLAQAGPVRIQLRNTLGGCWEADYTTSNRNDGEQFKATAD